MTDVPLFEIGEPTPLPRPAHPITATGPLKWANYRPKWPVRCDDCAAVLMEANRTGIAAPPSRTARFTCTQGALKLFICSEHKNLRMEDAEKH